MAKHLSDRVRHFFTINEFKQVTETAFRGVELHVQGKTVRLMGAPGILLEDGPLNQVRHNALVGHGLAVQAIRANAGAGTKVGPAENLGHAVPITDSPENVKAVIAATRALNIYFLGGSARQLLTTPSCRSSVRECAVLVASGKAAA